MRIGNKGWHKTYMRDKYYLVGGIWFVCG